MERACYERGSCIRCGCETTELQMCSKSCDGDCYPELMSKKKWKEFCQYRLIVLKGKTWRMKFKTI